MIRIFDVETTGIDPQQDKVVEIAAYDLDPKAKIVARAGAHFVKPGIAIPPQACAVHHITNEDVASAYQFAVVWEAFFAKSGIKFYAAHNCAFEQGFIPTPEGVRWLCTYKCALRAWPDAPGHSNQVLRYWRGIDKREGFDREEARLAHRAAPDAYVTAWLLDELIAEVGGATLVQWTGEPKLFPVLTFGKHYGSKWSDVPSDYLVWLRDGQHEMDVDWRYGARVELERRSGAQ
jgi:exodeoxyribonuclease X